MRMFLSSTNLQVLSTDSFAQIDKPAGLKHVRYTDFDINTAGSALRFYNCGQSSVSWTSNTIELYRRDASTVNARNMNPKTNGMDEIGNSRQSTRLRTPAAKPMAVVKMPACQPTQPA